MRGIRVPIPKNPIDRGIPFANFPPRVTILPRGPLQKTSGIPARFPFIRPDTTKEERMPARHCRMKRSYNLPLAYRKRDDQTYTPQVADAWRRFKLHDDQAAFQFLCQHYLYLVTIRCAVIMRRRPELFPDFGEMVSDGTIGLIESIRYFELPANMQSDWFFRSPFALRRITRYIFTSPRCRRWPGLKRNQRQTIIEEARGRLVQKLGRVPTPPELAESLHGIINNAEIHVGHHPTMEHFGCDKETGKQVRQIAGQTPDVDEPMLSREVVALALKGLKGKDRLILKRLIAGARQFKIAKELGLSFTAATRRMNGVLWEGRCRADLAEYLGVERCEVMPAKIHGGACLPLISKAPPAALKIA
jgi:DNA-directed RNA polymerase specialized sigma subunit